MDHLLAYIDGHLEDLVGDLLLGLQASDIAFRECDPGRLRAASLRSLRHVLTFARTHDRSHLDAAATDLAAPWSPGRFYLSAAARLLIGFEDLVTIRSQAVFPVDEDFLDTLRMLRAVMREALCATADRVQGRRTGDESAAARAPTGTLPLGRPDTATIVPRYDTVMDGLDPVVASPETVSSPGPAERLGAGRFVGRGPELQRMWERLRLAVGGAPDRAHEVIGVKAPDGYGKTTLLRAFVERLREHLGRPPVVLATRAPRLFGVPLWPFAALLRTWFDLPLGVMGQGPRLRERLEALAAQTDGEGRGALLEGAPHLLALLGDAEALAEVSRLDGRTAGLRLRRGLVAFFETVALQAFRETRAPLILEIEDAGEMDDPSWLLLTELLHAVAPHARLLVLLTYGGRFFVPAPLARHPGFTELTLEQFDMNEGDALVDGLLDPNRLDEATRFRLNAGARGSPLLLHEAARQLVEDGIVAFVGGAWVEVAPLPEEGMIQDLAAVVARRTEALPEAAREALELVTVLEDALGGPILEEVASRRALDPRELVASLERLAGAGLLTFTADERGIVARVRHPLVRDEIYRGMGQERRRAVHEDAGEVYERLAGAAAFPSLAADHLALAGLTARALNGLLAAVDRCLAMHELVGALELCQQAMGLLEGLGRDDRERFLHQLLVRRERVHGLRGDVESQAVDLKRLESLPPQVSEEGRTDLALRLARHHLAIGESALAERGAEAVMTRAPGGTPTGARARLVAGLAAWQQRQRDAARTLLEDAAEGAADGPPRLQARALHARGMLAAREGRMAEALHDLFEAWRRHARQGDLYGEAMTLEHLGGWFWSVGRLADGLKILRRSVDQLDALGEARSAGRTRLALAELHAAIGDFDEALRHYDVVLRTADRERDRLVHASATIGRGRVLVHRGRFDEAMGILAQCLKELGRRPLRHPIYVDALNALALNFATFARGEKLVVGGLRYAGEAADRATDIGHLRGLVQALGIQVRGLLALGRSPEAQARMAELDAAIGSAVDADRRLERMRAEVELLRWRVCTAMGDADGADRARRAAWDELRTQHRCLEGTGYERGFLANILAHREIVAAMGPEAQALLN